MGKTAVLVPCYKRPEYTKLSLQALEEAQEYHDVIFCVWNDDGTDETQELIDKFDPIGAQVITPRSNEPLGLRNIIINFFEDPCNATPDLKYIAKMDNDCLVPKNWLSDMIANLEESKLDILSPNVVPSNAAFKVGVGDGVVREASYVGGLWCMRSSLIKDMSFERFSPNGISGAFNIIKQIIAEKEARCGWLTTVTVQDIGHWSGAHPLHIKSAEHEEYSATVGRPIAWNL